MQIRIATGQPAAIFRLMRSLGPARVVIPPDCYVGSVEHTQEHGVPAGVNRKVS